MRDIGSDGGPPRALVDRSRIDLERDVRQRHGTRARRLRFEDSQIENAYADFHRRLTLPFIRFGCLAGGIAWIGNFIPHFSEPGSAARAWPWMLGLGTGGLFALLAATFTPAGRRIAPFLGAAGVAASAAVSIVVSFTILDDWATASAGLIIIVYFGYAIMRLPPVIAGSTGFAVTVAFQTVLAASFARGDMGSISFKAASTLAWTALGTGLFFSVFVDRLTRRSFVQERIIDAQAEAIAREQSRSDDLLRNVLPDEVIERLKDRPELIAEQHEVSVVFADLVGFTPMASQMSAVQLVSLLNLVFRELDSVTRRFGVEKIKTIGDAYMVVAGAPRSRPDHARAAALTALGIRDAIAGVNRRLGCQLESRIGIASGAAVAGVIGEDKFSYDIWGHTVNLAARLESHGVPGRIQIAEATYLALGDEFAYSERGTIEVKGIGAVRSWFLEGIHPSPSVDLSHDLAVVPTQSPQSSA
jgi:class 3 adenylate cyclase